MTCDILVIGLDGVGYEAIRDNDFDYLKQDTFGKVVSDGLSLKTPPIWSSFLTGVKEHGIDDFPEKDTEMGGAQQHTEELYDNLENWDPDESNTGGIGGRRDELEVDPWIENYDYEVINFPIYNYTNDFNKIHDWQLYWGSKCLDQEITPKEFIKKLAQETNSIFSKVREKAQEDHDIVLSYVHDTDYICHILYMHHGFKKGVLYFWKIVENQIRTLIESLDEEPTVLLLSDHGSSIGNVTRSEPGGHSPFGFYSFNKDLDVPESIHITEFRDILENLT